MKRYLFIALVVMAACGVYARSKTASKIGTSVLESPDVQKIQYEAVVKHNLVVDDIDSILVDIAGVSGDSISKTAVSGTRLYGTSLSLSDSGYIDTLTSARAYLTSVSGTTLVVSDSANIDTLVGGNVKTANADDAYITEIDTGTTSDTLKITIGGKTLYIAKDR